MEDSPLFCSRCMKLFQFCVWKALCKMKCCSCYSKGHKEEQMCFSWLKCVLRSSPWSVEMWISINIDIDMLCQQELWPFCCHVPRTCWDWWGNSVVALTGLGLALLV